MRECVNILGSIISQMQDDDPLLCNHKPKKKTKHTRQITVTSQKFTRMTSLTLKKPTKNPLHDRRWGVRRSRSPHSFSAPHRFNANEKIVWGDLDRLTLRRLLAPAVLISAVCHLTWVPNMMGELEIKRLTQKTLQFQSNLKKFELICELVRLTRVRRSVSPHTCEAHQVAHTELESNR